MSKKTKRYVAYGLILNGEQMSFVSFDGKTKSLPCLLHDSRPSKRYFLSYLKARFGLQARITRRILREIREYEDDIRYVDLYLLEPKSPCEALIPLYWDEAETAEIEDKQAIYVQRGYVYLPYLEKMERTIPFEEEDEDHVIFLRDAIEYFDARVPGYERKQFFGLIKSAASFRRINAAFCEICNTYGLDPTEYRDYLSYKKKERKTLR